MEKFKNIGQILIIAILVLIVIPVFILLVPILIPLSIYGHFESQRFKKKYRKYLLTIEGANFFCYTNKKKNKDFIEKNILPLLSPDVKVVFLNGRKLISDYEQKFISEALYSIKDRKGFPYLLKISEGELIDRSISNDFYNTMNQNKEVDLFFQPERIKGE